jgi:hypothetical protein
MKKDSLIKDFHSLVLKHNKPGVYALPQDNMPCIVPDTKDIAAIPNAWLRPSVPFRSAIPNPGLKEKPLVPQMDKEGK